MMYTPYSYGNGYFYTPPPPSPQDIERKNLRSTALAVGALLLTHIGAMQLVYPLIVLLLTAVGFFPVNAMSESMLGVDNTTYLLIYGVVYALAMGLPMMIICFQSNKFWPLSPAKPVSGRVGLFGILGGIGACMLANIVTSYILTILSEFGVSIPETPKMMDNTITSYLLNLLIIAVLPGILEEMVFRGCVLRMLRPYGDLFAVFVSALTFGLMHGNLRQIPFATIVGLVLGWLYVTTNNIWIPIVVHFLNNAVSVTMEYLAFSLPEASVDIFYTVIIIALAALGVVFGILLVVLDRRELKLNSKHSVLSGGQRFATVLKAPTFLIAMILFAVLTLLGM